MTTLGGSDDVFLLVSTFSGDVDRGWGRNFPNFPVLPMDADNPRYVTRRKNASTVAKSVIKLKRN